MLVKGRSTVVGQCQYCGRLQRVLCEMCRRCTLCGCVCKLCGVCKVWALEEHFCPKCGLCLKKCSGECKNIPCVLPGVKWERGLVNTLDRPVGLEVELANWGLVTRHPPQHFSYQVARDGSVHPSEQEMVLMPLSGDDVIRGLTELGHVLHTARASVNETCGLHVHVGGLDLNEWDIRRILEIYKRLEEDIYNVMIVPSRAAGAARYARKLGEQELLMIERLWEAKTAGDLKNVLYKWLYKTSPSEYMKIKRYKASKVIDGYSGQLVQIRYLGLNLHSWMHRGTLEFRMKEGTLDVRELMYWPLWCAWLVEVGKNITDGAARKVEGIKQFTVEYMPEMLVSWVVGKFEDRER